MCLTLLSLGKWFQFEIRMDAQKEDVQGLSRWRKSYFRRETVLQKSLLEPENKCLLFGSGSGVLPTASSQNGLIRADSSLAEAFLLHTKKCWALLKRLLKYCLPSFLALLLLVSWSDLSTWRIETDPRPANCYHPVSPSFIFSLVFRSVGLAWGILFMRPGSCQHGSLADCRGDWKCYLWDSTEYRDEAQERVSRPEQCRQRVDV